MYGFVDVFLTPLSSLSLALLVQHSPPSSLLTYRKRGGVSYEDITVKEENTENIDELTGREEKK